MKHPDERRDEIVSAARVLFATHGVHATTFQQIADHVGCTRGLVYHYAGSMPTLVDMVLAACVADFAADLREWDRLRVRGDIDGAVRDYIALFRRHLPGRSADGDADALGDPASAEAAAEPASATGTARPTPLPVPRVDDAGLYVRYVDASVVALLEILETTTIPAYAERHRIEISHVRETFVVLLHGLIGLMRTQPEVSDDVLADLVRQTLRLAPNPPGAPAGTNHSKESDMFLFEPLTLVQIVMWFVVLGALIGLNELSRRGPWAGAAFFIALPIILTIFVWPTTAGADSSTGTWFHWVKVYSALAGCLGFMAIRYIPRLQRNKWALMFPAGILALNIAEAVIRDFQVGGMGADGVVDGVYMLSGPWNYMNGIAGLINLLAITGWMGIYISRDKTKDMIWPDMIWPWIIAYDLWNFAYVYNCVGDHAFYAGAALLISCTIPAFFIRKGAWLQHRAHTLALWMMFTMAVPAFTSTSDFSVDASGDPAALLTVSALALAANIALAVLQVTLLIKHRRNVLKHEIYDHSAAYRRVVAEIPGASAAQLEAGWRRRVLC
ncbi:hypothetical protein GCM10025876_07500 [Demequina litorisediminis]|uniref:HTH tetR-type domain-containing protein n=1 Tax=Demequina litorisediminis TaxID=1849022 RepID=A0ABQ6IBC2_9MICO|nr:hypothetical protein GCM10025876_07500 [Demequina litorisediminis]